VDAAFGRIDDGTYGYDEQTGEPIDPERLAAEPTARRNIR
jgi:DnaK suppressor protein